jgi:hypothetical protein
VGLTLFIVLAVFVNITIKTQSRSARQDRTIAPEYFAAEFLKQNLTANDTVIAVAPSDLQTAYHLKINGIPYDLFYKRDRPLPFQNAYVMVRTRGEYNIHSLEDVINFFQLESVLDVQSANQVFEYGPLLIYLVPAR